MKRFLILILIGCGLLTIGYSNIAQAADCSCYTWTDCRNNWDGAPDECGGPDWETNPVCIKSADYCQCRYFGTNDCSGGTDPGDGTDPGGGLTQEQLDAIAAVAAALQAVQSYEGDAARKLAALNTLYASLTNLQNALSDSLGRISGAVATINNSLSKVAEYLEQGQALGPQALAIIEQQVVVAALQRGLANEANKATQGGTIADPVLIASGFETYDARDFVYKAVNTMIGVSRNFRSNQTDRDSSFGRSWFFNYDSKIVAGRKPLIKERELLTADLEQQAQGLADLATTALNEALDAVEVVVADAAIARAKADEIAAVKNDIASLSSSISSLSSSAASQAASASQNASVAGTSDAQADATSAQNIAASIASQASDASGKSSSATSIASAASSDADGAESSLLQAQENLATIEGGNQSIGVILDERIADADEAAAEARLEEETYPLDPYPSDQSVYFGPGFVKYFTEKGNPIIFEEDADGHFLPVTDSGSYTDEIVRMDGGLRLVDKHGNNREFNHNQRGDFLLTRIVDTNNNSTGFIRDDSGKLNEIIDSVGRKTTFAYNAEGYISLITDPIGNEYRYSYDGDILTVFTDPMGYDWSYEYDAQARMTARTDPENNSFRYIYDELGRVSTLVDKEGFTTHFSYDPENKTTIVTNPRGFSTRHIYNENNRLVLTINPDGSEVGMAYDGRNNVVARRDENGNTSYFTYNDANDVTSFTNPMGETTSISYEPDFNKIASVTDPLGRTRSFSYDTRGNLVKVTHPNGTMRTMNYSSAGLPVSVTDENGNTTTLTYDQYNQLASITNPDGTAKEITTDIIGRIIAATDENGFTSQVEYNPLNSVIRTIDPLEAETAILYDALQRKIQKTDAKGNSYSYQYSERSNLISTTDPLGNVESREYDEAGNLIKKTFPNGTGVTYSFDNRDRKVSEVTFPGSRETIYSYDPKGLKVAEQDANGNVTSYYFDAADRLITKVDAEGNNTHSVYDLAGNLTQVIDANNNPISYFYDEMNRKVQETNALGNSTVFTYDGVGNVTAKQKPDGTVIQNSYDTRNRLISTMYPDGTSKTYGYDNVGRMTSFSNSETQETRTFDAVGRLLSTTDLYNGQINYEYDILGNRTKVTDPAGGVMTYEYDAKNRVLAFTDPEGGRTTFEYDSMGRVVHTSLPNSTATVREYNDDNRLSTIATYGDSEGTLSSFTYTYDAIGNKLSMTEKDGDVTTYQYDVLNRLVYVDYPQREWEPELTEEEKNNGTFNGKGNKKGHFKNICDETTDCLPSAVSYVYDPVGNRLSQTDDWQTVEYQYNEANQMLQAGTAQFSYDENGNRVQKSDSGEVAYYSYNFDNLMSQVDSPNGEATAYGYDALNRRIYKVDQDGNNTDYLYDGLEVLQEITGQVDQKIATYYRANNQILTRQEFNVSQGDNDAYQNRPTGRQLYYSYDGLGSTATLSDHNGRLITSYQYDVFGQLTGGDITENTYTFTGQRFDEESGMYHFHFRQYDPLTGVWTAPDPIGIFGGINYYSYVENNPVNFWDWLGLTLSAGEAGVGNPGSYGGENTSESMGGTNGLGTGNTHGSETHGNESGFWGGVKSYFSGVKNAIVHGMRRSGMLGEKAQKEALMEEAIGKMVAAGIATDMDNLKAVVEAIYDYTINNKAKIAGRVGTGVAVSLALSRIAGFPGGLAGTAISLGAVYGDVKETLSNNVEASIDDMVAAILGGETNREKCR